VPTVEVNSLLVDDNKVGVVVHIFTLANRAVTCASPSKDQHVSHNLLEAISRGQLIDQLDNGLDFLLGQLSLNLRGVGCWLAQDRRELQTALDDISNELVTEGLEGARLILLYPRAANLSIIEEAEVLEALIDCQVNNRAKLIIQVLDHFISEGLGLHMIFNMDTRDNDMP